MGKSFGGTNLDTAVMPLNRNRATIVHVVLLLRASDSFFMYLKLTDNS